MSDQQAELAEVVEKCGGEGYDSLPQYRCDICERIVSAAEAETLLGMCDLDACTGALVVDETCPYGLSPRPITENLAWLEGWLRVSHRRMKTWDMALYKEVFTSGLYKHYPMVCIAGMPMEDRTHAAMEAARICAEMEKSDAK